MSIKPEGRKLLRVEARNAEVPIEKKPHWIKTLAVAISAILPLVNPLQLITLSPSKSLKTLRLWVCVMPR